MSRITKCMEKAARERTEKIGDDSLEMAVQRTIEAMGGWSASPNMGSFKNGSNGFAAASNGSLAQSGSSNGAQKPESLVSSGHDNGKNGKDAFDSSQQPLSGDLEESRAWEQSVSAFQQKLVEAESRQMEQRWQIQILKAKADAQERLKTEAAEALKSLSEQRASAEKEALALETDQRNLLRRLKALSEHRLLSQRVRTGEQELEVANRLVEETGQARERMTGELNRQQKRRDALERTVAELRQRLGEALAVCSEMSVNGQRQDGSS